MAADVPSTKQRLLSCTVDLMAMHGSLESVSLRAVAGAAGVSPTAVYRHFDDRDALVVAAIEWAWGEFDRALDEANDGSPAPHERLQRQCHAYVGVALARSGVYTVLFGHRGVESGTRTDVGSKVFAKMTALVREVLLVADDPRPSFEVATQLFTSIHGVAHLRSVQPAFPWPELDDQIGTLLRQLGLSDVSPVGDS